MSRTSPHRRLTLVRHAHAEPHDSDREDFERRLDKRGRREARTMAARAAELGLFPDHLVTSPADRAAETAREFAKAFDFPLHRIRHDDRIYEAPRELLASIVRGAPGDARHVMLFGHNPGISRFAAWTSGEQGVDLPTCAVWSMSGTLEHWTDLASGTLARERCDAPE